MIIYGVMFLSQHGLGDAGILDDALVITKHLCRSFQGNAKHTQLVSNRYYEITGRAQGDELAAES